MRNPIQIGFFQGPEETQLQFAGLPILPKFQFFSSKTSMYPNEIVMPKWTKFAKRH